MARRTKKNQCVGREVGRCAGRDVHDRVRGDWRGGFSLPELLIVIAIIVILLALLLPSLSKARERARALVCLANLRGHGNAEQMYRATYGEWIVGSPLTTGNYFTKNKQIYWGTRTPKNAPCYNRLASMWDDYATPLRSVTLGASSIAAPDESTGNAEIIRARLVREAMEGAFECPSNDRCDVSAFDTNNFDSSVWKPIKGVSYMTMWTLMRGGQNVIDHLYDYPGVAYDPSQSDETDTQVKRPLTDPAKAYDVGQYSDWDIGVPAQYMPNTKWFRDTTIKVFLADGTRYFDENTRQLDYYPLFRGTKGLWMATPPSSAEYRGSKVIGREYNHAASLSYRHGNNDQINAVFFDGHAGSLQVSGHKVSRSQLPSTCFSGNATDPKYYYPSGSIVNNPAALHMSSLGAGTKLP
ncbi:MAG: prepilin-type N-terminal cleavage/methylation domain-containing protein [Phycisphaerae bacterium]|nr:prepilin-type N-terminal cleavage/methylation domain-containing protein [Phycisphaerae bacterium]